MANCTRRVLATLAVFACGLATGHWLRTTGPSARAEGLGGGAACAPVAVCHKADMNGDGDVDVSDPIFLLRHLFAGGEPPRPCPGDRRTVSAVIVVRHAERDPGGVDPPLNAVGEHRAERLADVLGDLAIDHLIASDLQRTVETLEPAAAIHSLDVEQIAGIDDVVARVRSFPQGTVTVVAHHSFTIGEILDGLGVDEGVRISGHEQFFVVLLPELGTTQVLKLRY
ncbi:MAG: histidine phosphatase family protein [Planctomycetota bacterium]|nr:histidine phosphatase family protein [Planctomycetota bacterium]